MSASTTLQSLTVDLVDGIPATITLDGGRNLVLAVPLGIARAVLSADPLAVVYDDLSSVTAADARSPLDLPRPRLTLVSGGRIGETTPVVPRRPVRLTGPGAAGVDVWVDRLVITAGSLCGPGRFSSRLVLRWRDLLAADDTGVPAPAPDPAMVLLRTGSIA